MSKGRLGLSIGVLVLLGLGVWAGLSFQRMRTAALQWEGPVAEILSERLDKRADTMTMEFTSRLDAPLADIWQAFSEPERSAEFSETIRVSRLLQAQGNSKLILFEMVMLGQPQRLSMQFIFSARRKPGPYPECRKPNERHSGRIPLYAFAGRNQNPADLHRHAERQSQPAGPPWPCKRTPRVKVSSPPCVPCRRGWRVGIRPAQGDCVDFQNPGPLSPQN